MASPLSNQLPKGYKAGRLAKFLPQQMNLFNQLFNQVGPQSYLSRLAGGEEGMFQDMERPALRQFKDIQGNIASRFSGMGLGGRHSSGFQNVSNQAAADLAENLAARRQGLQSQALSELLNLSGQLLNQQPYENFLIQKPQRQSFGRQILGGALPIAGAAIGGYFGGPQGAAFGSQLGSMGASAFTANPHQANFEGIASLPTRWGA